MLRLLNFTRRIPPFALVLVAGVLCTTSVALGQKPPRVVTAADMPRIPSTPADEALETFHLPAGFRLEMVAAEPMVSDPVDACFDERGRMYVAEMHGYPFSHEPTRLNPEGGGKKDAGIIRLLEDVDGDGAMDRSTVFADELSWPTSICCYNGGVFVLAPKYLYYLKDNDGDGKADQREVVLEGFGRGNVQSVSNGLLWDLDNRICFAAGRNPKSLRHRGKPLFAVGAVDLRFDPKTETFERVSGGVQFGHSIDDWGVRFVCSNSNHIQQVVYDQRYLKNHPLLGSRGVVRSIAADGASAPVFRKSPPEPWRIVRQKWRAADKGYRLVVNDDGGWEFIPLDPSKPKGAVPTEYPVGYFTSATGITIYRGDAYPGRYRGNAFVGDVGGNLVHRKVLDTSNVVYQAQRADEGEEIVASTDNWFRPVNFVNAPDGSLYILDMYRETIEHPYSIPEDIKKFLDLSSGDKAGRIYRLVSPDMQRRAAPDLSQLSDVELVSQLASANAWNRETAQRVLYERGAASVAPQLRKLVSESESPLARLHALYVLKGCQALAAADIEAALRDSHPRIRAHGLLLLEQLWPELGNEKAAVAKRLEALAADDNVHVRFQLGLTLGELPADVAAPIVARLAAAPAHTSETLAAWSSAATVHCVDVVVAILKDPQFFESDRAPTMWSSLAEAAGMRSDNAAAAVLGQIADLDASWQRAWLAGAGRGMARRGANWRDVLKDADEALTARAAEIFASAVKLSADDNAALKQRAAAARLLGEADWEVTSKGAGRLLQPQAPPTLQLAAVDAVLRHSHAAAAELLLQYWKQAGPQVRRQMVTGMRTKKAHVESLLAAIEAGTVKRGDLQRDSKQALLKHPTAAIRQRAEAVLGGEVATNRRKVVDGHQDVLELDGATQRGAAVFKAKCAACHRAGDVGNEVAPNFASVQNKSPADLLIAILDPNREAQPNFNVYNILTEDGELFSGMIVSESETAITLKQPEGKEVVLLRSNISRLVATGLSLMPEGLEKDLSKQQLADVIAFIKTLKPKP